MRLAAFRKGKCKMTQVCDVIHVAAFRLVGWLLEFYVRATSNVISRWAPTCDSAHSCCPTEIPVCQQMVYVTGLNHCWLGYCGSMVSHPFAIEMAGASNIFCR